MAEGDRILSVKGKQFLMVQQAWSTKTHDAPQSIRVLPEI